MADDLSAGDAATPDRPRSTPPDATLRGVWETVSLMEYVILIIVIAVLAVATGGWLLFVRPGRGLLGLRAGPGAAGAPGPGSACRRGS